MQPPRFVLNCLGVPRLLTPGGQEVRVKVKKHLATLIVLAVDGGKINRDRLVSLLWPSARPDRARGSVATAISFLRAKIGGEAIEPSRDWVQLRRGHLALDLDRLTAGEIVGDDFTPALDVDAFLAGFEIDQVPEFDEWRERQHARLLPAVEKGLMTLADHARRSGDLNGLARYADQLLELNDLSEAGIKARMEAYALSGDRITAIKVYDDWVERLQAEVRATPDRVVEDLANRLRRRSWDRPTAEPGVPPVHTEQWRNQHFVGRSREYRRLYDLWEQTRNGVAKHVLMTGDSGVGKTTLADRFATALALEGASVARIRCFELESGIPYATIGSIVESLLDRPGASGTSPDALAELARILPEIKRRYPALPPASESTGEAARLRFAEAALELVEAVADERAILLSIDDIDQSDDASLGMLHLLLRRLKSKPFMVVLTSRTGAPARREEFRRLRAGVQDLGMHAVDVEPLSQEESELLFDALVAELGLRPTPAERRALLAAAAGFPLAIELMLRDWQVHGVRSTPFAIQAITSEVQAHPEARYQQLTESLLADLDDTERLVVHLAAILDRRVGDLKLYQVAGLPQAVTLATLSRMIERRALRDTPGGLEWINPSVRAHAYLAVPASLRRALHEGVFEELVNRERVGHKVPGLELAWHSIRAGRVKEASTHLLIGAREATLGGAARQAELALVSGMPLLDDSARTDAMLCLAEILLELGRPAEAIDLLHPLVGSNESSGTIATLLQLRGLVEVNNWRPELDEVERVAKILTAIAHSTKDLSIRARAVSIGVGLYRGITPSAQSQHFLELGSLIAIAELSPVDAVELLVSLAKQHYYSRDLRPCEELLLQAIKVADAAGVRNTHYLSALNGLGAAACAKGDYETGFRYSLQLHRSSIAACVDRLVTLAAANAALCAFRLGRYSEATAWAERVGNRRIDLESGLTSIEVTGLSKAIQGDRHGGSGSAAEALEFARDRTNVAERRRALFTAGDILVACGEFPRAREIGADALALGSPLDDDPGMIGRYSRWRGALAESAEELEELAAYLRGVLACHLDELDRVEVLGVLDASGFASLAERRELTARREALPPATLAQLSILRCPQRSQPTVSRWGLSEPGTPWVNQQLR